MYIILLKTFATEMETSDCELGKRRNDHLQRLYLGLRNHQSSHAQVTLFHGGDCKDSNYY